MNRVRATIVRVESVPPRCFVTLQLREGEIAPGQQLVCGSTQFRVEGVAFGPPEARQSGLRLVSATLLAGPVPEVGAHVEERK
jgi:hypothetical protein